MVARLAKALADQVRVTVRDLELTEAQAAVLRGLETPLTQRDIANLLVCQPSNVTFVVDRLESRGLIQRTPHPTDRRAKVIRLTEAGREVRAAAIDRFESSSPLAGLNDDELDQLEALLAKAMGDIPDRSG